MKPMRTSLLLTALCLLTLLSGCGNHDDPATSLSGGAVDGGEFSIPGEEGPEGQLNIQMVKAGLREANEVRHRRHLPTLRMDWDLVIAAQQKARQMCGGQNPQTPGFPDRGGDYHRQDANGSDGVSALPGMGDGYNGQHRGPHFPQQPQYPQPSYGYAENIASGLRGPGGLKQALIKWQKVRIYSQNLLNPGYGRQGFGYCQGNWVQLLAN